MPSRTKAHTPSAHDAPTRRQALGLAAAAGSAALLPMVKITPAQATPEEMRAAIARLVGEARINKGRVKIDIPPLVENGNTVPCTVTVESPMTEKDYVKAIHVFNEKNPQPHVFDARLGPRNGKAAVGTRIKLGDSQKIVAIAETSKGEFFSASADVIVTLAACLEEMT